MSAATRRRSRSPQMLSVSKQSSAAYPQTRSGANVFSRHRIQRRRRWLAFLVATVALVLIAAAVTWVWFLPK